MQGGICFMFNETIASILGDLSGLTISLMNEGICFFLFHQPPFPEKARKIRNEGNENASNSRVSY